MMRRFKESGSTRVSRNERLLRAREGPCIGYLISPLNVDHLPLSWPEITETNLKLNGHFDCKINY